MKSLTTATMTMTWEERDNSNDGREGERKRKEMEGEDERREEAGHPNILLNWYFHKINKTQGTNWLSQHLFDRQLDSGWMN